MPNDKLTAQNYEVGSTHARTFAESVPAFASGTFTPRDMLEECLAVIDTRESDVKAWVELNAELAKQQADASTARWREGRQLSPIDGMPVGIKDLLETRDMPTQMGCEAFRGAFPKRDNAIVWALRQAGAVIVGKTVTTELGGAHPGPTKNPWNLAHSPGGSSSGSAAAVAAGMVPVAVGTQVGGSIIRPASFCGNWAIKPSQGAVHRGERQATTMSTHGTHANSPEDMWTTLRVVAELTGGDPGFPRLSGPTACPPANRPLTVATLKTEGWDRASDAAKRGISRVAKAIEAAGVTLIGAEEHPVIEELEDRLEGCSELTTTMTAWENQWQLRNILASNPDGVSDRTKRGLTVAENLGPSGYERLTRIREQAKTVFRSLRRDVDVFVTLGSPGPAPQWEGESPELSPALWPTGDPVFNTPASMLGIPAINVPMLSVDGLPLGVQIMGQAGDDARLASYGRWMAELLAAA
ncbi:amidase [Haloechinothrix salitolerans]|uniref:Amidase n=1 Tax=Haloechinothrix salitolerans TaxID=926830 RepID=A0ABW2C5A1_9PSEU